MRESRGRDRAYGVAAGVAFVLAGAAWWAAAGLTP